VFGVWVTVIKLFAVACAVVCAAVSSIGDASARTRCADARSPMTTSQSYGVATCKSRAPRYHAHDYLGEGARGYVRRASSDPMVWSDARWRGSLMSGYSHNTDSRYDRRFRRDGGGAPATVVKHVERIVIVESPPAPETQDKPKKRKPRFISMRGDGEQVIENSSRFRGHRCAGILVLKWGAGGSRARCYNERGRIRRPL
jgi:hypothetical protein